MRITGSGNQTMGNHGVTYVRAAGVQCLWFYCANGLAPQLMCSSELRVSEK